MPTISKHACMLIPKVTVLYCISNLFFQEYEKKLALLKKAVDKKGISDPGL